MGFCRPFSWVGRHILRDKSLGRCPPAKARLRREPNQEFIVYNFLFLFRFFGRLDLQEILDLCLKDSLTCNIKLTSLFWLGRKKTLTTVCPAMTPSIQRRRLGLALPLSTKARNFKGLLLVAHSCCHNAGFVANNRKTIMQDFSPAPTYVYTPSFCVWQHHEICETPVWG